MVNRQCVCGAVNFSRMSDDDTILLLKKKCAAFIVMHHLITKKREKQIKKKRRFWIKHLFQTKTVDGGGKLLKTLPLD